MDDHETEKKLKILDSKTSSLVSIGPGEKGYLHQREALNKVAKRIAEDIDKTI